MQSATVPKFFANLFATFVIGAFVATIASMLAAPIAFLLMPTAFLILRRIGLSQPVILAVIGAAAGTLFFWAAFTNMNFFYEYEGGEKLAVAAIIGGAGGFAGGLIFSNSMQSTK